MTEFFSLKEFVTHNIKKKASATDKKTRNDFVRDQIKRFGITKKNAIMFYWQQKWIDYQRKLV